MGEAHDIAVAVIEGHRVGYYKSKHPDYEALARGYLELEKKCEELRRALGTPVGAA